VGVFWVGPVEDSSRAGPKENQEVTTSKIVTFFGGSPDADRQSQSGQDADLFENPDRVKTSVRKRQHLEPGF